MSENEKVLWEIAFTINKNKAMSDAVKKISELETILRNIQKIIEGSLSNVGRNEDCFEYYLGDVDCERILEMIPEFDELEGNDVNTSN